MILRVSLGSSLVPGIGIVIDFIYLSYIVASILLGSVFHVGYQP